eukprot:PhM_4_TR3057/c2_g1_i2/m.97834
MRVVQAAGFKQKKRGGAPPTATSNAANKRTGAGRGGHSRFREAKNDPRFTSLGVTPSLTGATKGVKKNQGKMQTSKKTKSVVKGGDQTDDRFRALVAEHTAEMDRDLSPSVASDEEIVDDFDENEKAENVVEYDETAAQVVEDDDADFIEATNRIAVIDYEWEFVRAVDLHVLLQSFCPEGGSVKSVAVYLSDLGKAALDNEDAPDLFVEGTGERITDGDFSRPEPVPAQKKAQVDDDDDDVEEEEEEDLEDDDDEDAFDNVADYFKPVKDEDTTLDQEKLKEYEAKRRKYYYAIATFDSPQTAHATYKSCDGQELETTNTTISLRYVPDDVDFEESRKTDESTYIPQDYQLPVALVALARNPNAKNRGDVSWDQTDARRTTTLRNAFNSALKDMEMDDLDAYVASDASSEVEDDVARKNLRKKYAALLEGFEDEEGGGDSGDSDADSLDHELASGSEDDEEEEEEE